jgi:hypothetical protein
MKWSTDLIVPTLLLVASACHADSKTETDNTSFGCLRHSRRRLRWLEGSPRFR